MLGNNGTFAQTSCHGKHIGKTFLPRPLLQLPSTDRRTDGSELLRGGGDRASRPEEVAGELQVFVVTGGRILAYTPSVLELADVWDRITVTKKSLSRG